MMFGKYSYYHPDTFHHCSLCAWPMIGIVPPRPDNGDDKKVAREVCYSCEQSEKTAEVAA